MATMVRNLPAMSYPAPTTSLDDSVLLDNLAAEMQLNHPKTVSIFTTRETVVATLCGGCGAELVSESVDDVGRTVKDYACGHRYLIGRCTVTIERV